MLGRPPGSTDTGGHDLEGKAESPRSPPPAPINSQLRLVSVGPGVGHAEHPAARVREVGPELVSEGLPPARLPAWKRGRSSRMTATRAPPPAAYGAPAPAAHRPPPPAARGAPPPAARGDPAPAAHGPPPPAAREPQPQALRINSTRGRVVCPKRPASWGALEEQPPVGGQTGAPGGPRPRHRGGARKRGWRRRLWLWARGAAGTPGAQRQHPPVPVPVGSPPWICGKSTPVRSPAMSPQLLLGTMGSPPPARCGQLGWGPRPLETRGSAPPRGGLHTRGGAAGVGAHHEVADGPVEDGAVVVLLLAEPDEVLTGFRGLQQAEGSCEPHSSLDGGRGSRGPQPGLSRWAW